MADYYEILGVPKTASAAEVRSAYLRLARERHPDRFPDPAEKARAQDFFKELTAAFNTLSNDRSRREYDESLARPQVAVPEEMARKAFERGMQQFDAKQYFDAVELFRTAVQHAPEEARYHFALGLALARNPHWVREAVQAVEKAVQLDGTKALYHVELGELFLAQGLKLRARRSAEAALRLAPGDERALRLAQETGAGGEAPASGPPPAPGGILDRLRRKP